LGLPRGVLAGVITFTVTVTAVVVLLVVGGTCKRIREQQKAFDEKGPAAFAAPFQRVMLYDELLEASAKLPEKPTIPVADATSTVEIVAYSEKDHLEKLHAVCCGDPVYSFGRFDAEECLFRFLQDGPFDNAASLGKSSLLNDPGQNGVRLAIKDRATGYLCGTVSLLNNSPKNLRIEVGDVWLTPALQRTHVFTATMLALLGHLFEKCQYRRVEWRCDALDARSRKSIERVGFLLEGIMRKQRVVRGSNQDTALYAMMNNDWRDGGNKRLTSKLRPPDGISAPTRKPSVVGKGE
jgi:hypothetical protein